MGFIRAEQHYTTATIVCIDFQRCEMGGGRTRDDACSSPKETIALPLFPVFSPICGTEAVSTTENNLRNVSLLHWMLE
jgi:hypothetical protein